MKQQLNVPSPIISIIVPIYNREKWLRNCLDSISAQIFKEWECILINDGSTDNSLKIAQEYAENDERFIVFSQENQGVSAARNLGLDHAQGKWVTFVDSDDEIAPDYLEILHKIGEDNNADLVNGSIIINHTSRTRPIIFSDSVYTSQEEDFGNMFRWRISGIIKLFRLDIIRKHHLRFDKKYQFAEDLIFSLEFYLQTQRIATSSKAIYTYNKVKDEPNQLHKQKYSFPTEIELYNKLVSFYEQFKERYPHSNEQLIFNGLFLQMHTQRIFEIIESQTKSLIQRYKMYRYIKLPSKNPVKGSFTQTLRHYLLYKQQYFLFALSRIWVNRH